jgi:LPXTG-motif cell wall-anchored protein
MKKSLLTLFFAIVFLLGGLCIASGQERPAGQPDTVNIDTDAKPEFYYDIEDEESMEGDKGANTTIIIIAAVVIIAGGAALVMMKKKK